MSKSNRSRRGLVWYCVAVNVLLVVILGALLLLGGDHKHPKDKKPSASATLAVLCDYPYSLVPKDCTAAPAYAARALQFDDPGRCLLPTSRCDASRECASFTYSDKCLLAPVPLFTSLERVACCFHCCVSHVLRHYGLLNLASTNALGAQSEHDPFAAFKSDANLTAQTALYPLFSSASIAGLSSAVWFRGRALRSPHLSSLRISSIISTEQSNISRSSSSSRSIPPLPLTLRNILAVTGRATTLVTHSSRCEMGSTWLPILQQHVLYGQPRLAKWFSTQLLCTRNDEELTRGGGGSSSSSGSGSSRLAAHAAYSLQPDKIALIAQGVRDPEALLRVASSSSLSALSPVSSWAARPALLSCACLDVEPRPSHDSIRADLSNAGVACAFSSSSRRPGPSEAPSTGLDWLYAEMQSAQFVLSPSVLSPTDDQDAWLSACEWEALALGAIPVFLAPPHATDKVHFQLNNSSSSSSSSISLGKSSKSSSRGQHGSTLRYHLTEAQVLLDRLLHGVPLVEVQSARMLTSATLTVWRRRILAGEVPTRGTTKGKVGDATKAFLPYWLHQLTRSLPIGIVRRSLLPSLVRLRAFLSDDLASCSSVRNSAANKWLDEIDLRPALPTMSSSKGAIQAKTKTKTKIKTKTKTKEKDAYKKQQGDRNSSTTKQEHGEQRDQGGRLVSVLADSNYRRASLGLGLERRLRQQEANFARRTKTFSTSTSSSVVVASTTGSSDSPSERRRRLQVHSKRKASGSRRRQGQELTSKPRPELESTPMRSQTQRNNETPNSIRSRTHHMDAGGGNRGDGGGIGGERLQVAPLGLAILGLGVPLFGGQQHKSSKPAGRPGFAILSASTNNTTSGASPRQRFTPLPLSCRLSPSTVDIVVPRCCEEPHEMAWLPALLLMAPQIRAFVYYKCPWCLPESQRERWAAGAAEAAAESALSRLEQQHQQQQQQRKYDSHFLGPSGVHVLDDSFLVGHPALQGRVKQIPAWDGVSNTKEAGAYLAHIVKYYNPERCGKGGGGRVKGVAGSATAAPTGLADHTFFLHTDPGSHLALRLFERVLAWLLLCDQGRDGRQAARSIPFLPLAGIYLGPTWGTPEGAEEAWLQCRKSLYEFVGIRNETALAALSAADNVRRSSRRVAMTDAKQAAAKAFWLQRQNQSRSNGNSTFAPVLAPAPASASASAPAPALGRVLSGDEMIAAYKAGLFVASRETIQRQPLELWKGLLMALRGEARGGDGLPLPCGRRGQRQGQGRGRGIGRDAPPLTDTENGESSASDGGSVSAPPRLRSGPAIDPGPMLGGQVERLWHVFFGREALLKSRTRDLSLPRALREPDCAGFGKCGGAV